MGASHGNAIFQKPPNSTQNPLLSKSEFFKHCRRRFRWVGNSERGFVSWLEPRLEKGLIRAAYHHNGAAYFSTFQIYQVWYVHIRGDQALESGSSADDSGLENLLRLLIKIQDFYLPETRSNQRSGEYRDHHGAAAIGGTHFSGKTQYMLSVFREWRQRNIKEGYFDPAKALSTTELDLDALIHWRERFEVSAKEIDPLSNWRMLVKYIRYGKRQQLKFEALLAQDFYEMASLLELFVTDLDVKHKYQPNPSQREILSYGDSISHPYEMLEFLSNGYDLNPNPRAIIFTEGEEWKAVERLFTFYDYDPELLGIEFRSISGTGNFSLANWQGFIEYMHEKQTLVYFLLDNEGRAVKEANRLLNKNRIFAFPGLEKVTLRDRIRIWAQSFEESNFTDAEIKRALAHQGVQVSSHRVANVRTKARTKGLINELSHNLGVIIDKPRLDIDLANELVSQRRKRPNVKSLRPIEEFIQRSGHLIMLNHQPANPEMKRRNIETGLIG